MPSKKGKTTKKVAKKKKAVTKKVAKKKAAPKVETIPFETAVHAVCPPCRKGVSRKGARHENNVACNAIALHRLKEQP